MKSRILTCITTMTVLTALAIPVRLAAQEAPTYTVLYTFTGGADGVNPSANVIRDKAGNLYGTTGSGGSGGQGVVFKLDRAGRVTELHSFTGGADGGGPAGGLIRDSEVNLYGTTFSGGAFGAGLVFKLEPTGKESVLYSFTGGADGGNPQSHLVQDAAGNLYGTTDSGGSGGSGVVFKLEPTGKESVLYSFTGGADGGLPLAGLIQDEAGNLYGTTLVGGSNGSGVVFKVDPNGMETVLYSFTGGADGGFPVSDLVRDAAGNLYGTASGGGS